jgi:hypothetical protein
MSQGRPNRPAYLLESIQLSSVLGMSAFGSFTEVTVSRGNSHLSPSADVGDDQGTSLKAPRHFEPKDVIHAIARVR